MDTSELHKTALVIDTHVDSVLPWLDLGHDPATLTNDYLDIGKMDEGNLSCAYIACCVNQGDVDRGYGAARLKAMLTTVHNVCERNADRLRLARSAEEIVDLHASNMHSVVLTIEGGQAIGDDVETLSELYQQGVRSLGLGHFKSNAWVDSSTDEPLHHGLSRCGRRVVELANKLGIVIDVSHVSDAAFWQILDASSKPVFASHSCARAVVDHPRNLTDDMIAALARQGGLIGVTWWPEYISGEFCRSLEQIAFGDGPVPPSVSAISVLLAKKGNDRKARYEVLSTSGVTFPSLERVVDHIDHVAAIAGSEHVCIGSDPGAVRFELEGLIDCSELPQLTRMLIGRGYSEDAVRGILGGNAMRYMGSVLS